MIEGQLITPTLRLVRMLGRGGMGSVWVADHLTLQTQVAVKFMFGQFAENEALVRRFRAEAIAAVQIKSPHVAQVFDHGVTSEGEPYIVMELLEGEDLRARMKRSGAISPADFAPILTQIAKALTRAHQVGIVHRDIKPDNVFLTSTGDELLVKVLDFGIAKITDDASLGATATGSMLGTPYYMSPEQLLSSRSVDFRSDLWSLGVVTYLALTGTRPFRGETVGAISVAVNKGLFPPPSATRSELSPSIDSWMERALQQEPARRFGSAREMAEAFERAVHDASASADMAPAATTVVEVAPKVTTAAPTLAGTTKSSATARGRRAPLLLGLAVLGAAAASAAMFARATRAGGTSPANGAVAVAMAPSQEVAPPAVVLAPPAVPPQVTAVDTHEDAGSPVSMVANPGLVGIPPSASAWPRRAPFGHLAGKSAGTAKPPGSPDAPPPPPQHKDDIGF